MTESALSLGSNVGDRLRNIRRAVELIALRVGDVTRRSCVYETPPWGVTSQPGFLNACVLVDTELRPAELLSELKRIESEVGRVPRERWGPREIDIDILTCGGELLSSGELEIPHPRMAERAFVLVPLRDAAPGWRHPESGLSIDGMLRGVDTSGIARVARL
ncbi:MAG: 2-amino-4-hydroxy-6-hydroxymethyldihydropteridine diphosphokinase [Synergistaceae bacterium]|jgi:2-amino-4-hydroxy-6-hydroxymethyldihydropteridine diphosphokinase|nr:2-amino-4-hydroxy-6-hydroxymethyldihydropteridine diphosphokinase [Synergistaceae bacterium]